jgi:hypothetical protein
MTRLMNLDRLRTVIEEALSVSVEGIQLPGITKAVARGPVLSSEQLQRLAAQLEQHGQSEIRLSAEVELYLRISNTDLLGSIECTAFRVRIEADDNHLRAVASL